MPGQFNHRELVLLKPAVGDPWLAVHSRLPLDLPPRLGETACHDLMHLEALELLVRGNVGRGYVWTPAPDLSNRLTEVQ